MTTSAQEENLAVLFLFFGIATLVGTIGWQTFQWLRSGNWPFFDCVTVLSMIYPQSGWLGSPQDWLGLHKVLSFLHTGITLGVPSIFIGISSLLASQREFDNKKC